MFGPITVTVNDFSNISDKYERLWILGQLESDRFTRQFIKPSHPVIEKDPFDPNTHEIVEITVDQYNAAPLFTGQLALPGPGKWSNSWPSKPQLPKPVGQELARPLTGGAVVLEIAGAISGIAAGAVMAAPGALNPNNEADALAAMRANERSTTIYIVVPKRPDQRRTWASPLTPDESWQSFLDWLQLTQEFFGDDSHYVFLEEEVPQTEQIRPTKILATAESSPDTDKTVSSLEEAAETANAQSDGERGRINREVTALLKRLWPNSDRPPDPANTPTIIRLLKISYKINNRSRLRSEIGDDLAFLYRYLGFQVLKTNDLAKAEEYFRQAYYYDPTHPALAKVLRLQGRPQEALQLIVDMMRRDSSVEYRHDVIMETAENLLALGHIRDAERAANEVYNWLASEASERSSHRRENARNLLHFYLRLARQMGSDENLEQRLAFLRATLGNGNGNGR